MSIGLRYGYQLRNTVKKIAQRLFIAYHSEYCNTRNIAIAIICSKNFNVRVDNNNQRNLIALCKQKDRSFKSKKINVPIFNFSILTANNTIISTTIVLTISNLIKMIYESNKILSNFMAFSSIT